MKKIINTLKANIILRDRKKNNEKIMLNIGCGTDYKQGWINIDNNSENNIKKLDLKWDLRCALPFPDDCVDFIYSEHFFEHLTVDEGKKSLRDFFRVLKKGGVMRTSMPNLKDVVEMYLNPEWKKSCMIKKFGLDYIQTSAEMINVSFRHWGHKWLYDYEELKRRLVEIGCVNIEQCLLGQSKYDDLKNLEIRNESTLIVEVTK
ncbi:MAG TPA: hypothetical protein DDY52_01920 [Candidatus Moranbacteria bacterium]|nr:MAG: Glycosyl transferase, family 2 [Candidatus Moranbacteria bacterium GW2011_GWF1_34_10]HBI16893.1 hypothetical protein [Candidatus Moranbacteria bacterium]